MSRLIALFTSDPFLAPCEALRARELAELGGRNDVAGMGAYQDGVVLLRHQGPGQPRDGLWVPPESDAVVLHSFPLPVGLSLEDNAQPWRFRQWVLAHAGAVDRPEQVRERLVSALPEFLQRAVRGTRVSEAVFATFLAQLRDLGRMEDPGLEAVLAAQVLSRTAALVDQVAREVGGAGRPELNLVATNGRAFAVAHRGPAPLWYTMLEGEAQCERCGIPRGAPDQEPLVREHRRRRSLLVATHPLKQDGWVAVADGGALAVDRKFQVQSLASVA